LSLQQVVWRLYFYHWYFLLNLAEKKSSLWHIQDNAKPVFSVDLKVLLVVKGF
jgi:hypothetical protein